MYNAAKGSWSGTPTRECLDETVCIYNEEKSERLHILLLYKCMIIHIDIYKLAELVAENLGVMCQNIRWSCRACI